MKTWHLTRVIQRQEFHNKKVNSREDWQAVKRKLARLVKKIAKNLVNRNELLWEI